jgi:hypothetical protein
MNRTESSANQQPSPLSLLFGIGPLFLVRRASFAFATRFFDRLATLSNSVLSNSVCLTATAKRSTRHSAGLPAVESTHLLTGTARENGQFWAGFGASRRETAVSSPTRRRVWTRRERVSQLQLPACVSADHSSGVHDPMHGDPERRPLACCSFDFHDRRLLDGRFRTSADASRCRLSVSSALTSARNLCSF